jgi:hypothetical protein
MAYHGIDALYRLTISFSLHGVVCQNVWWLRSKETSTSPSLQNDCDNIESDWRVQFWPLYKLCCSNELVNTGAVVQCMNPLNQAMTVASYVNQTGSTVGESLPAFCASVIGLYTRYPGRRTHGRVYVPGVPEAEHSASQVTNAQLTKLANLAALFVNRWGENGSSLTVRGGVFSRKNGVVRNPGPPPYLTYSPLAHVPWTRTVINSRVRTERHRMQGRGI